MSELSNEELAMRIAAGKKELIPQLWSQAEGFIVKRAKRYFTLCCGNGNVRFEMEDLIQGDHPKICVNL